MSSLKKLTVAQLSQMIDETKAELKRRENIEAATSEMRAILKKYKIDIQDIDTQILRKDSASKGSKKRSSASKSRDQRRIVKAKFKDPDGTATWTGRGRTPSWVVGICAKNGIDVDTFKKDDRFQCA